MHRRHRWFPREMTSESRNERRNSILMTYHYPDLGTASKWMKQNFKPIRNTTEIRVVSRHQPGISALVSQKSFRVENTGGFAKYIQAVFSDKGKAFLHRYSLKRREKGGTFLPPSPPKLKEPETKARDQQVSIPNFPYSFGGKECLQIERFYL